MGVPTSRLMKATIYPLVAGGSFYLFWRALTAGVPPGVALFGLSAGSLTVIALLEILAPLRREWAWWTDRQTFNDLAHGALMSLIGPKIGEIALLSAVTAGAAALAAKGGGIWPTHWPFLAQLLLAILIADFADWPKHWLYHHWPAAWPIHALHHNSDRMHVAKAGRLHFLESTIRYALITAPLLLLGAPGQVLLWHAALLTVLGNLVHSNIDMPMPSFLHYLIVTPDNHRLHHSSDPKYGNTNMSLLTMLADHLFGTFRHPVRHRLVEVGIGEDPIPGNVLAQLAVPMAWPWLMARLHKRTRAPVGAGLG